MGPWDSRLGGALVRRLVAVGEAKLDAAERVGVQNWFTQFTEGKTG